MRWHDTGINYGRGTYLGLIFKFDNSNYWMNFNAIMTIQAAKYGIRRMGKHYESKSVSVKPYWNDEEDKPSEELVLDVATFGDDLDSLSYKFYEVHENGNLINKIYYTEDEVFG